MHVAFPKPIKGAFRLERQMLRATRTKAERKTMADAKRRDGGKCRWPGCRLKLTIHACHRSHRGMGGNPDGTRTTRENLIALCSQDHQRWDLGLIDIQPQTAQGFDGPADFYERSESGRFELVASERVIGVSEART
jgi:hypothetical protein